MSNVQKTSSFIFQGVEEFRQMWESIAQDLKEVEDVYAVQGVLEGLCRQR
jgi:hypothetical protein